MKWFLQLITLAAIALSLNSCGLPGALVRSAGRVIQGADSLVGQAMTTGV
jgi:hypothetical protein